MCVADPLELLRICMPNIATLEPPPMHRDIANALQDQVNLNHNFIAPRGHAKTSVAALGGPIYRTYCIDEFCNRPRRPHFTLIVSRSRSHSINLLTALKNTIEYSDAFKAIFGYHGQATAKKWSEDFVYTAYGDVFMARGMGQMVRGLNVGGMRPDTVILDDGEDEENTKTAERMEANLRWFLQALVNVAGEQPCTIMNIGTPQHQRAIVFTLKDMPDWTTHHYSAIIEDPVTGEEHALWPEMRSLEWLHEKRKALEEIGRGSVFQREYMCRVVGDEDQLFREQDLQYAYMDLQMLDTPSRDPSRAPTKKHFLRIWKEGQYDENGVELPPTIIPVNVFMGIDPASSTATSADYTAIVVIAVDADGNRYVIDVLRKRMKPVQVGDAIIDMFERYQPNKTQVETVGYQEMLAEYILKTKGIHIPGLAIKNNPRRGKTERLEGLQPLFYQKMVWLRAISEAEAKEDLDKRRIKNAIEAMRDELLLFPRSRHDDTLDGFWYANKGAYLPFHSAPVEDQERTKVKRVRKSYDWEVL